MLRTLENRESRKRKRKGDSGGDIILDGLPSWKKRIVSEMIHIKKQQSGINKQSNTDFLSENYLPLINISSPK